MTDKKYRRNVGLMIIDAAGRVLMCERIDPAGSFQMPQGGIDAGETPEQAAWRELQEEVGLTRDDVRLLAESDRWHCYDFPPDGQYHKGFAGQCQRWFLFLLTGGDAAIDFHRHASVEFQSYKWMTPAEAVRDIWAFKRPTYQAAFDEFKPFFPAGSKRPAPSAPESSERS